MAVVVDASALIAVDRADRAMGALLRVAHEARLPVRTSTAVVAQVWRDGSRQASLARVLAGVDVVPVDGGDGRAVGELLGLAGIADVVDGYLALALALVVRAGDTVLTGDVADLRVLVDARGVGAAVRPVGGSGRR
jgi:hypothetical protein